LRQLRRLRLLRTFLRTLRFTVTTRSVSADTVGLSTYQSQCAITSQSRADTSRQ